MAVFATRETAYLDNMASFFNSVKSGRILMMSPITYVKTENSTTTTDNAQWTFSFDRKQPFSKIKQIFKCNFWRTTGT